MIVGIVAALALVVLVGGGGAVWYFMKGRSDTKMADSGMPATGSTTTGTSTGPATGTTTGTTTVSPAPADGGATASGTGGATSTTGTGTAGTGAATTGAGGTSGGATSSGTQASGGGTQSGGGATVQPTGGGSTGGATGSQRATTGGGTTAGTTGGESRSATRVPDADLSVLDQEPPELTGRETGAGVADTYRNNRGASGGSFGASGRLRARTRVPQDLTMHEKRAAVVLLNLMGLENVHKRRGGSYGNFQQVMPVPVASADRFDRAGYRFELKLESDGFTIMATSMNGRALMVDDSGFVRYVD